MAYLTKTTFAALTVMPSVDVDALEVVAPGWIDAQLDYWSGWIDSRLAKRYAVPFSSPPPDAVKGWLARIVTLRAYMKRGIDPNDAQFSEIKADADAAGVELKEAADSGEGLFDLPLREDTASSGIARGGPLVYSEASPYVSFDDQLTVGVAEDRARRGTSSG